MVQYISLHVRYFDTTQNKLVSDNFQKIDFMDDDDLYFILRKINPDNGSIVVKRTDLYSVTIGINTLPLPAN